MTTQLSTRKYELALPLLAQIEAKRIFDAQKALAAGDLALLPELIASLAKSGEMQTVRKLSAIYSATETELKAAAKDATILAEIEERAADRPFNETFSEVLTFFFGAALLLGASPTSLGIVIPTAEAAEPEKASPKKTAKQTKSGVRSKG